MWCRHCQQDVPAVARLGDALRVCPRCASPLRRQPLSAPPAAFDAGVELDADVRGGQSTPAIPPIASPFDALNTQLALGQLRRRLRPLGAPRDHAGPMAASPAGPETQWRFDANESEGDESTDLAELVRPVSPSTAKSADARWIGSILVLTTLGSVALVAGVAMLLASSALTTAPTAVRGMTLAFAGQGLLYFALAGMFARAWRDGAVDPTSHRGASSSSAKKAIR